MIDVAKKVVERYRAHWLEARRLHDNMVLDASVSKTHLPDNYWQDEYKARQRYYVATKIAEAMQEGKNETL